MEISMEINIEELELLIEKYPEVSDATILELYKAFSAKKGVTTPYERTDSFLRGYTYGPKITSHKECKDLMKYINNQPPMENVWVVEEWYGARCKGVVTACEDEADAIHYIYMKLGVNTKTGDKQKTEFSTYTEFSNGESIRTFRLYSVEIRKYDD